MGYIFKQDEPYAGVEAMGGILMDGAETSDVAIKMTDICSINNNIGMAP